MTTYLKASQQPIMDLHALALQNNNPKISHYRQGFDHWFNNIPKIGQVPLQHEGFKINDLMHNLVHMLASQDWVKNNTPIKNPLLRTVIGMEQPICIDAALQSGAELIVVNWQNGATTPTHGHAPGYMHERLIFGKVRQATYRIVDAAKMLVRPIGLQLFCNTNDVIDAGYNDDNGHADGAFVHDFTFLQPSATLNLVPSHPKDTKGNVFTVERFTFKDIGHRLELLTPISLNTTLHLPPGEVILVRSETTKDLGDHFYVITEHAKEKRAGMRPVGNAIHASKDFSDLLDTIEGQDHAVKVMHLMPAARDLFLEWHGIQVQKTIVFPQP